MSSLQSGRLAVGIDLGLLSRFASVVMPFCLIHCSVGAGLDAQGRSPHLGGGSTSVIPDPAAHRIFPIYLFTSRLCPCF